MESRDGSPIPPPPAPLPRERQGTIPVISTAPPKPEMSRNEPGPSNTSRGWEDEEDDDTTQRTGINAWIEKLNPIMVLENSGSVARDHLANERTWLAYVRTSLAIASTGVALVQLFTISAQHSNGTSPLSGKLQRFARPLGAAIVIIGLVVLALGVNRYFRVQYALTLNQFPPARKTVGFISTVLVAVVAIVFGILVGIPRR